MVMVVESNGKAEKMWWCVAADHSRLKASLPQQKLVIGPDQQPVKPNAVEWQVLGALLLLLIPSISTSSSSSSSDDSSSSSSSSPQWKNIALRNQQWVRSATGRGMHPLSGVAKSSSGGMNLD
ncbi:hypothetical protein Tco_0795913 [Tanacetum coccineum]